MKTSIFGAPSKLQLWYPVHRRWIIVFRIFAVLGGACLMLRFALHHHFSLAGLLLVLWFISLRPVQRPRTPFYFLGIAVHWLFFTLLFCGILATLVELLYGV